jgi:Uma2 family endonuclease
MMSNTDLLAPNVSFIFAQKLKRTVRDFGNLVPDLVVEIKSKPDRVSKLEDQLKLFLELGAKVAILINSDELIVNLLVKLHY